MPEQKSASDSVVEIKNLAALRRRLKKQRRQLSVHEQQWYARQTVDQIVRHPLFRQARHIALYIPVRGELDIRALRRHAQRWQRFYLPVLSPLPHQGLTFLKWQRHTGFTRNRFGIPEPVYHVSLCRAANQLDLVVTPLLAVDAQGHRLGMGGGFYDRTFAFKQRQVRHVNPVLLGVAYPFQEQAVLPAQPWDIPLDALATAEGVRVFKR